jgi:MFS family permease
MTLITTTREKLGPATRDYVRRTFSSLQIRNYRLYFIGQGISLSGTFMQGLAQAWLVLTLTKSATAVGIVSALQFGPVLLLASYGGILADRFSKRRLLFLTQSLSAVLALVLWMLVATHSVQLWMVYAIAATLGVVNAMDNPARQTFVHEMVGGDQIQNAVTLNATELNLSRVIGPAIAGILIATVGMALCFLINAASFVAVLVCLAMMRAAELHRSHPVARGKGQLREGFRYVWNKPVLRDGLVMMALIGTFTFEFQVSLSVLARNTFAAGEIGYSMLTCAMGVGAVAGGLVIAGLRKPGLRRLVAAALAFGATVAVVAVSPTLWLAVAAMAAVGACSIAFTSLSNTILQVNTSPRMRGRVMSLWSMAFLGSTVIGAPIVGWVADRFSPQWGLGVGAVAALAAGVYGLVVLPRHALVTEPEGAAAPVLIVEDADGEMA